MRNLALFLTVVAVLLGFCVAATDAKACNGVSASVVGYAPCAEQINIGYAAPPAASFWAPQFYQPEPIMLPAAQYVQSQAVVGFAPQPVTPVYNAHVKHYRSAAVVGYQPTAAVVGAPVALWGRFAGSPAVGRIGAVGQINAGFVGAGRERVLRPSVFKRRVGAPVATGNIVVGAVQLNGY